MAVQAALTGHLVCPHCTPTMRLLAVTRLLELGVPAFLIQSSLRGVIAQRLVRTLCPHCKAPTEVSRDEWEALVAPFKAPLPKQVWQAIGCLECRTPGSWAGSACTRC
jgi:general secretion pathway protein E